MNEKVTISYAIPVCNEVSYIGNLLAVLEAFMVGRKEQGVEDEVVILQDVTKQTDELNQILENYQSEFTQKGLRFKLFREEFNNNFADWKNSLNSYCSATFIFQIDADECPYPTLLKNLPTILEMNPEVELYKVPRENFVEGLTQEDIARWGWRVEPDNNSRINWPDYQDRIYRNVEHIGWAGKVHEKITGFTKYATLPAKQLLALEHRKTIDRQRKQNNFYQKLQQK